VVIVASSAVRRAARWRRTPTSSRTPPVSASRSRTPSEFLWPGRLVQRIQHHGYWHSPASKRVQQVLHAGRLDPDRLHHLLRRAARAWTLISMLPAGGTVAGSSPPAQPARRPGSTSHGPGPSALGGMAWTSSQVRWPTTGLPEGVTAEDVVRLAELAEAMSAELEAILMQRTTAKCLWAHIDSEDCGCWPPSAGG
jgi:hypothetical protein